MNPCIPTTDCQGNYAASVGGVLIAIERGSVADPDEPQVLPFPKGEVVCRERLGGLLKHYSRAAA